MFVRARKSVPLYVFIVCVYVETTVIFIISHGTLFFVFTNERNSLHFVEHKVVAALLVSPFFAHNLNNERVPALCVPYRFIGNYGRILPVYHGNLPYGKGTIMFLSFLLSLFILLWNKLCHFRRGRWCSRDEPVLWSGNYGLLWGKWKREGKGGIVMHTEWTDLSIWCLLGKAK